MYRVTNFNRKQEKFYDNDQNKVEFSKWEKDFKKYKGK